MNFSIRNPAPRLLAGGILAMILATAVSIAPSSSARVRWLLLLLAVGAGIFALLHRQWRL